MSDIQEEFHLEDFARMYIGDEDERILRLHMYDEAIALNRQEIEALIKRLQGTLERTKRS